MVRAYQSREKSRYEYLVNPNVIFCGRINRGGNEQLVGGGIEGHSSTKKAHNTVGNKSALVLRVDEVNPDGSWVSEHCV